MHFLDFIKPDIESYNNFCNYTSAIVVAFRRVFGFDLKDVFILPWMKDYKTEPPS